MDHGGAMTAHCRNVSHGARSRGWEVEEQMGHSVSIWVFPQVYVTCKTRRWLPFPAQLLTHEAFALGGLCHS